MISDQPVTRKYLVSVAASCTLFLSAVIVVGLLLRPQTEWQDHVKVELEGFERRVEAELDAMHTSLRAQRMVTDIVQDAVKEAVDQGKKDEQK